MLNYRFIVFVFVLQCLNGYNQTSNTDESNKIIFKIDPISSVIHTFYANGHAVTFSYNSSLEYFLNDRSSIQIHNARLGFGTTSKVDGGEDIYSNSIIKILEIENRLYNREKGIGSFASYGITFSTFKSIEVPECNEKYAGLILSTGRQFYLGKHFTIDIVGGLRLIYTYKTSNTYPLTLLTQKPYLRLGLNFGYKF